MDELQRHVRNAKLFELTIDNFNEWNNEGAIERTFGPVGDYYWYTRMLKISRGGVDYLSISVVPGQRKFYYFFPQQLYAEIAICVKNQRLDRWEKCQGRFEVTHLEWCGWETFMRMDTILDPGSGFLRDDGALVMQIEIRIDYFIMWNGNKLFNFCDPFEGCVHIQTKYDSINFYTCKQMLMLHSPVLAEQLADGRNEVDLSGDVGYASVELFLQLIHGLKVEVPENVIRDLLYFAHKYQVLTLLRQLEFQIKRYHGQDIKNISFSYRDGWIKTLIGEEQHKDLLRRIAMEDGPLSEEYKEAIIRKKEALLTITRASPFPRKVDSGCPAIDSALATQTGLQHELDSEPSNNNNDTSETDTPPTSSFSILRFLSETVKRITDR